MAYLDPHEDEAGLAPLVEAPALSDQVYERLRDAILRGELAPGERIAAAAVAERLGISTMPVRDALRRLEQDGLVESRARRWTRVVRLEPSLVEEVVPLACLLEQYALSSAPALDEARLDRMRAANAEFSAAVAAGDVVAAIEADTRFHGALVALAANASLERALRDLRTRVTLLRARVLELERASASARDHDEIVAALARGDREEAARWLAVNWERGITRFRETEAG
jgi:DNA-binding GntR family transcriptional regulator